MIPCEPGFILKYLRRQKHISQSDMCRGLCNVSMASRIENGERIPSRKLIGALFSRIGEISPSGKVLMTHADFEMRNLEYKIIGKVADNDFEIKDLIDKYISLHEHPTPLEQQFYELYKSEYLRGHEGNKDEVKELLLHAIRITIKDFSLSSFTSQKLFSQMEIAIMNSIANVLYYEFDEKEAAISILERVMHYFKSPILSEKLIMPNKILLSFNLSNWHDLTGNPSKALAYAEEGVQLSIKHGRLDLLPYLVFNRGYMRSELGNKSEGETDLLNSFILFDEMKMQHNVEYALPVVNEKFGFHFSVDSI